MIHSVQKNGYLVCLSGEWYETYFNNSVMKEPNYNIRIMSTLSVLTVP